MCRRMRSVGVRLPHLQNLLVHMNFIHLTYRLVSYSNNARALFRLVTIGASSGSGRTVTTTRSSFADETDSNFRAPPFILRVRRLWVRLRLSVFFDFLNGILLRGMKNKTVANLLRNFL
jgi:hypothetical protein